MPKDFNDCVKNGGKVRTKNLKNNRYIRICYDKDGNSHAGEVRTRKKFKKKSKATIQRKKIEASKRLARSLRGLQEHFHDNYHD